MTGEPFKIDYLGLPAGEVRFRETAAGCGYTWTRLDGSVLTGDGYATPENCADALRVEIVEHYRSVQ